MAYADMARIVDRAVQQREGAQKFARVAAASLRAEPTGSNRRRWLRLRENAVGLVNDVRRSVDRQAAQNPKGAAAELVRQARQFLADAMSTLMTAVPAPSGSTPGTASPADAPRPRRGQAEAELHTGLTELDRMDAPGKPARPAAASDVMRATPWWDLLSYRGMAPSRPILVDLDNPPSTRRDKPKPPPRQIKEAESENGDPRQAEVMLRELDHAAEPPRRSRPRMPLPRRAPTRASIVRSRERRIKEEPEPVTNRLPSKPAVDEPAPPTLRSAGQEPPPSWREAPTRRDGSAARRDDESETGWDLAIEQSRPRYTINPAQAREARRRIRAATAPAFAAALDRAVDAGLLTRFAARHPSGVDAAKLRAAFVDAAVRRFAGEFVKLVGGRPPASAEDIALGAIIAVAIAETGARFPIVPPTAVAPMAVLVHRTLRPRLPALARMAAVIAATAPAAAPTRPAGASQPAREMAW